MRYHRAKAFFVFAIFSLSLILSPLLAYGAAGGDVRIDVVNDTVTGVGNGVGTGADVGAQNGAAASSRVRSARYSASGGVETITVNVDRYDDVHAFFLSGPNRYVMDIKGATLPAGHYSIEVGMGSVLRIRFSMFDAQTARFVVDLSQETSFALNAGKGFIKAEAQTGAADAEPVMWSPESGGGDDAYAIDYMAHADELNEGMQQLPGASPTPRPNSASAQVARTPRPTRIPALAPTPTPPRRATPRIPMPEQTPAPEPGPEQGQAYDPLVIPPPIITKDEFRLDIAPGLRVIASFKNGANTCTIEAPGGLAERSRVIRGEEAPRVAVEIPFSLPGGLAGSKSLAINSDVLKGVSVSQPDAGHIRISLDVRERVGVVTATEGDKLVFKLVNDLIPNVGYHKNGERAFVTLYQTALTSGSETLTNFYVSGTEDGGKTWTVTFDNDRGKLGEGAATVDDDLLNTIGIYVRGSQTSLVIAAKEKVALVIYTKLVAGHNLLETTISILKPASASERLIVIDAGHGGYDPGAVGLSGRLEKDFNLDIAIKLKEALAAQGGVRVFLTRDDDYFVDLYERAQLANVLNATLFVSIHANATSTNPDATGIETLYCPSEADEGVFTSKVFAEMTQRKLISTLRTADRGIVPRPNLVVLRRTHMPAVLVEAGFVTNTNDLLNLSRSAYRKNTANAIADAVIDALSVLR